MKSILALLECAGTVVYIWSIFSQLLGCGSLKISYVDNRGLVDCLQSDKNVEDKIDLAVLNSMFERGEIHKVL